ncbi:MAG: sugar ABC transporter permease [Lachnospiraceae bacterium]|nr:sugar ABC transporter permease [Lachnospiraceae bacterium]
MKKKLMADKVKSYLMFAGPAIFFFFAIVIIPFIYGVYLTFTNWDGISAKKELIGFANFLAVFQDKDFWSALMLTLAYVAISTVAVQVIAFLLAYLLTSGLKGQNFFRAGFFTPNLIGGIVLGFIWQFVFSKAFTAFGGMTSIPLFESSWLSDPLKAFFALVLVTVWQYSGYMMLIYVAGFVGVPKDLIEAASIDGCTNTQRTRHIVIPMMSQSFSICTFLTLTRCFMVYDLNVSLTGGEPYGSTIMAALHVYQKAFKSKKYGLGQAEALVLFVVVAVVAVTQYYLSKRKEVEA